MPLRTTNSPQKDESHCVRIRMYISFAVWILCVKLASGCSQQPLGAFLRNESCLSISSYLSVCELQIAKLHVLLHMLCLDIFCSVTQIGP